MNDTDTPTPDRPEYFEMPGFPTAVVRRRGYPVGRLSDLMDAAFTALGQAIEAGRFVPAGPPFARYDTDFGGDMDLGGDQPIDLEVGFPVATALAEAISAGNEEIIGSTLPSGMIARAIYTGSYDGLPQAWETFTRTVAADGYSTSLPFWEAYHTMPTPNGDPEDNETGLAIPVSRG